MSNLTPLGYALIGLAIAEPRTGYALRKVFETTPMGRYSSSPGSIYPALAKLEGNGLLEKRPASGAAKENYHATRKGRAALKRWLVDPVTLDDVANNMEVTMLRFAFLESVGDVTRTIEFLYSFREAVDAHLKQLRVYMKSAAGASLSAHGRLAMESGIGGYAAQLKWADHAIREFSGYE